MNKTLLPCPFCGGEAEYYGECDMVRVECSVCGANTSGWWDEPEEAAAEWNRRAQPENKPLTLDELKQMDGEPVWIVLISVCDGYWDICKRNDYDGGDYIDFARIPLKKKYYEKTWLAYRRAQQDFINALYERDKGRYLPVSMTVCEEYGFKGLCGEDCPAYGSKEECKEECNEID